LRRACDPPAYGARRHRTPARRADGQSRRIRHREPVRCDCRRHEKPVVTSPIVVTGTDTGIGKTVFSTALVGALDGCYWKPVQSGLEEETDSEIVGRLSGLAADRILPERYRLKTPASPHLAAEIDGITIDPERLQLPEVSHPLVIEGAGGL